MSTLKLTVPFLKSLEKHYRVILASGSPRRRELLDRLFPENLEKSVFPSAKEYVLENATQKALDVYRREKSAQPLMIIGSDTVVVDGIGKILEKPESTQDAIRTLKGLSGKTNTVYTGVCLVISESEGEPRLETAIEATTVLFSSMDDALVEAYVSTGEPMDKAGSYAYQSLAAFFIKEIHGDFYNVMGFPCARFYQMLQGLHNEGLF